MRKYTELTHLISYHVFCYIENGKEYDKIEAINLLKELADVYHIPVKKVAKINLKQAFKNFLINKEGYINTINKLISSL